MMLLLLGCALQPGLELQLLDESGAPSAGWVEQAGARVQSDSRGRVSLDAPAHPILLLVGGDGRLTEPVVLGSEDLGEPVPQPSRTSDLRHGPNEALCLVDAWLPIFREERRAGSVKKNVTVPLWLNVLAEKKGLNFSQVLQAGLKSSLGIQDR